MREFFNLAKRAMVAARDFFVAPAPAAPTDYELARQATLDAKASGNVVSMKAHRQRRVVNPAGTKLARMAKEGRLTLRGGPRQ